MVGPSAGPYTVYVDNREVGIYNASRSRFSAQTVLYQETGMSPGQHTVRVVNFPFTTASLQTVYIDYAVVWGPS